MTDNESLNNRVLSCWKRIYNPNYKQCTKSVCKNVCNKFYEKLLW